MLLLIPLAGIDIRLARGTRLNPLTLWAIIGILYWSNFGYYQKCLVKSNSELYSNVTSARFIFLDRRLKSAGYRIEELVGGLTRFGKHSNRTYTNRVQSNGNKVCQVKFQTKVAY